MLCGADEFVSEDGKTCHVCPPNTFSVANTFGVHGCQCAPGFYLSVDKTCVMCQEGKFKASRGPQEAHLVQTFTSAVGSVSFKPSVAWDITKFLKLMPVANNNASHVLSIFFKISQTAVCVCLARKSCDSALCVHKRERLYMQGWLCFE